MKVKKHRLIIISLLIVLVISVSIWFGYNELTRPTSPIIAIDNNIVSWTATGTGDMTAGRFIRSYESRVALGRDIFAVFIEGPTEIGETMVIDLSTLNLGDTATTDADISVRTIRTLGNSTRFSRWSNTVYWTCAE